jgi:hypothetical protein
MNYFRWELRINILLRKESKIYAIIINGRAARCKNITSKMLISKKMCRISFPAHLRDFIFNEKSGISAVKSNENITVIAISNHKEIEFWKNIREDINKALAGVGRPIKFSSCLESTLNFAKRNAENTAIKKAMNGSHSIFVFSPIMKNSSRAGKTPNDTISANESSSLPIADFTFNNLADIPSPKSKIKASQIRYTAYSGFP